MHPFTGFMLWLTIAVQALMLSQVKPLIVLAASVMLILLLWPAARHRTRFVLWLMLPMALSLWLIHGGWLNYLFNTPPTNNAFSPQHATILWLRLLIVFTAAQLWLQIVPVNQLVRALLASRLPVSLAYLLASPLLLSTQLTQQIHVIREAQLARGVRLDGNFRQRASALVAMLWPLLNGTLSSVNYRAAALESRAFRAVSKRTTLWPPLDPPWEQKFRWCMVVALGIEITGGILCR